MARKKTTTTEEKIIEETFDGPEEITPEDSVVPVYLVPLTAEELAEREQWAVEQAEREAKEIARGEAKKNAIAKLAELGLTVEEIEAAFNLS